MLQYNHDKERSKKMYLRILKKDLKRKKTMNVVLLLFVILATMFSASSVNNIITVVNGLDNYFEKAGMTDYYIIANGDKKTNNVESVLKGEKSVTDFKKEEIIYGYSDYFIHPDGEKIAEFTNCCIIKC